MQGLEDTEHFWKSHLIFLWICEDLRDVVTMIDTNIRKTRFPTEMTSFIISFDPIVKSTYPIPSSDLGRKWWGSCQIQARSKGSKRSVSPTLASALCAAGDTQQYEFDLTQTWAHDCSSLELVRHYGAAFFYVGSVPGEEARARCTELTQQRLLSKDPPAAQPIAAYSYGILERTSGALSPAASYWHINNTINLICHWVLRDRLLAPAEQKALPKGGRRGHQS